MKLQAIKKEFPFTNKIINLNNAGVCSPPAVASEYTAGFHKTYSELGLYALIDEFAGKDDAVRSLLADLLGCNSEEIAITHNTAEGMNVIAQGFPFQKGDIILAAGKEYPANVYPWLNLEKKGVTLKFINERNGEILIKDIEDAISSRVKMITVSFVQWCSGYKIDIIRLGKICNNAGIPLVVDGAQGIGALNLDVKEANISALSCPCWKWLWGPIGLGFLYMKKAFMEGITPVFVGADGVKGWDNLLEYNLVPREDMRRFEYATKNYSDIVQFSECLKFSRRLGINNIENYLLNITQMFSQAVREAGCEIYGDFNKENQSGIFSFTAPGMEPQKIKSELFKNRILVNLRDDRVRISPHVYLDEDDVEEFIKILSGVLK